MPEDRNKRHWPKWLWNILLIALAIGVVQWWQTRELPAGPAPPLAGRLLDGRWVDLREYRGTPLLVHFWATWCPICRAEQGTISSLAEDVPVLTVATGSGDAAQLSKYLEENRLGFPVLLDESGELARRWKIVGVPASFVIDPRGDIVAAAVGYTTEIGLRLRLWLAKD
jgi:peroxiredoxin